MKSGTEVEVAELATLLKKEVCNKKITFSGGEPFYQSEFLLEMLKAAKAEGLHTCIETCGFTASSAIKEALPYVDLFLFDFKESDEERHKELTGVPLEPILNNLRLIDENGGKTVLRCPIIPKVNLSDGHLDGIAKLVPRIDCDIKAFEQFQKLN